jgi:hypothetical protein
MLAYLNFETPSTGNAIDALESSTSITAMLVLSRNCLV